MTARSYLLIGAALAICPSLGQAQQVLFQCNFDGTGVSASDRWVACGGITSDGFRAKGKLVSTGWGQGALMLKDDGWAPIEADIVDTKEVTITYRERFDKWPLTGANTKSIRPYYGTGGADYVAAVIGAWFDEGWYQSAWLSATLIPTSKVTDVDTRPDFCKDNRDGTYDCRGADGVGRLAIRWTPGYGTDWHLIRMYIKMPTNDNTADGLVRIWIDEELLYTLRDIKKFPGGSSNVTSMHFFPSDDAKVSYGHYLDEIKVYAGEVPPSGGTEGPPKDVQSNRRTDTK